MNDPVNKDLNIVGAVLYIYVVLPQLSLVRFSPPIMVYFRYIIARGNG